MAYRTPEIKADLSALVPGGIDTGPFVFRTADSRAAEILEAPPLAEYVARAWPVVEPGTPYVHGWHIDAICEHLEAVTSGEVQRLIVNIPPRHSKSLQVSVFWPTWTWVRRPATQFLTSSYSQKLSTRDAVKSRRLIQSPWYQSQWGSVFSLTSDQNEKMRYENDRGGHRIATSVGGTATGEGGDIRIVDDPHKADAVMSDTIRESDIGWWRETWSSRGNDPRTSAEVIIMQRLHERDLTGYILAEVGGYEHLVLPARYEPDRRCVTGIGWEDPRREAGELLWGERFDDASLADLEARLGSYGAAGQLQQRPSPAEGGILKREWWQRYDTPPDTFDEVIQSWDMSFKDTDGGSFVVGQVWGRVGASKYLLDQDRDRRDFPRSVDAVRRLTARWPVARLKLIEDKANGPAVISTLKNEIAGIVPVMVRDSKLARAHAVSPDIEAGNVFLPFAPWADGFIEECASFPNGANDDQVDAMAQALDRLSNPHTVRQVKLLGV